MLSSQTLVCLKKELQITYRSRSAGNMTSSNERLSTLLRSVAYLAPEMLRRTGHNRTVDWYLLGVLIYEMVVGIPPYFSVNRDEMFLNIQKAQLKIPKSMPSDVKDIIKRVSDTFLRRYDNR